MALIKLNNQSLTAVTSAGLPSGTVLQVVNATYSIQTSTTSTTFVSTGLTATITPTSSSNKILCIYSTGAQNNSSANGSKFTLFRGTVSETNLGHSLLVLQGLYTRRFPAALLIIHRQHLPNFTH